MAAARRRPRPAGRRARLAVRDRPHCLLNTRRGEGRRDALAVRVADALPHADSACRADADLVAQRIDLAAAWRRLSDTEQEALSLTVFEDLTSPQAARVLGVTPTAYRLRLLRARRALRRQLDLAESSFRVQMGTES